MFYRILGCIILLFIAYVVHGTNVTNTIVVEEDDHSFILTDANWDHVHSIYEYLLVFFYKPDCNECIIYDEIFVYTAKHAKVTKHDVKFGFVDTSKETGIRAMEIIETFPTIKFYRNQTGIVYQGIIGKDYLMKWLNNRVNYQLKSIETAEDGLKVLIENPLVVIACILSNNLTNVKDYEIVSSLHEDVEFRLIQDAEVCERLGLFTSGNSMGVYQYQFGIEHRISGDLTRKAMNDFIENHHVPIFSDFDNHLFTKSFEGHYHYFVPIIYDSLPVHINDLKAEIRSIAKEVDGKVVFIYFDKTNKPARIFLSHMGIDADEPGFLVVESSHHLVRFKPDDPHNLTGKYMLEFIQSVLDGTAKADLKSTDPEPDWEKKPVRPLVQSTFDQLAHDPAHSAFVVLYHPDCKYSKELMVLVEELAEFYKDREDVNFGKFNIDENEHPRIKVKSTPMMLLFTKGMNEKIEFIGERTLENIKLFIESNGKEGNDPILLDVDHLQHAKLTEKGLYHEEL